MPDTATLDPMIRAGFTPCSLGTWPTPLEGAPALAAELGLAELWLKREDRSSPRYGGSKVRGLEFLLAGAHPGEVCVTIGGTGSTHCLATAVHSRALGLRTVLAQFPQPDTDPARATARAASGYADVVVRSASRAGFPLALLRAWLAAGRLGRRRWIPGGGAHPRGVLGQLLGTLELAGQTPGPPDAIVLPLGSGGTAAGVALGLSALGWQTRVIAVRVAPRIAANAWRVAWLAHATRRLLADRHIPLPAPHAVTVVDGVGGGYGHPTVAGEAARTLAARHGLTLDSTYGAKAFAALRRPPVCNCRRVVFWHTFAEPPLMPEGGA